MRLSQRDRDLFRQSFDALSRDVPVSAECFYRHLFSIAPETRGLFVADLDRQGVKLMATLRVVADQIDNWGLLRTELEELAIRHTAYGVLPRHYSPAGHAMQAMLAERLGPACTPEVAAVWRRVYDALQTAMIDAAYPSPEGGMT
jgi:hemoglobin-like flavoprotein